MFFCPVSFALWLTTDTTRRYYAGLRMQHHGRSAHDDDGVPDHRRVHAVHDGMGNRGCDTNDVPDCCWDSRAVQSLNIDEGYQTMPES